MVELFFVVVLEPQLPVVKTGCSTEQVSIARANDCCRWAMLMAFNLPIWISRRKITLEIKLILEVISFVFIVLSFHIFVW